jgi:Tfp pilus assembly protein PilF
VCSYGLAWLEFARNNRDIAWTLLNNLVWEYDYSYLHNALWTYYDSIGNTSKAQEHYTTALSLTLSQEEKTILTNKLLAY